MEAEIKRTPLPILKCMKCGHEWVARIEAPKTCPACKNYNWHKEKTKKES